MYRFKNSVITLIGVMTLVGIVTVAVPHIGRGAAGATSSAPTTQTQNVNVVNTPSVNAQQSGSWNVGISGTPTVAVSNFPATTNVGIDSSANTVKIDPAAPVLVRDVDNPARQSYANLRTINLAAGQFAQTIFFSEVPAGKQLVIEEVSVSGHAPTGQVWQLATIGVERNGTDIDFDIQVNARGTNPFDAGQDQFSGSQQVRLYSDPGSTPKFVAQRNGGTGFAQLTMSISGYFVDLP
jgi:hypothetical protein